MTLTKPDLEQLVINVSEAMAIGFTEIKSQNAEIKSQNAEIKSQNQVLQLKLESVEARLERIESNTIIIRDAILSQFEGISAQTKADIERLATEALDQFETVIMPDVEVWNKANPNYNTVPFRRKRQEQREVTIKKLINLYNPLTNGQYRDSFGRSVCEKGYESACGNWVSGVMSQVFKTRFNGKYPLTLKPLLETLVGFWAIERKESNQRLY